MTTFLHNNCDKMLTPRRWTVSVTFIGQMYFEAGISKVKILRCPFCGKKAKEILKSDYPEFIKSNKTINMKTPNIIKLSDSQLATARNDFNFIFGYLKSSFKKTLNKKEMEYFENKSAFKRMLDQINKMSIAKFIKHKAK